MTFTAEMLLSRVTAASRQLLHKPWCRSVNPTRTASAARVSSSDTVMASEMASVVKDPCSQANFQEARVVHSAYELDVDFKARAIQGWAQVGAGLKDADSVAGARAWFRLQLDVQVEAPGVSQLVLDTSGGLTVHNAEVSRQGGEPQPVQFSFGPQHKVLGTPLHIPLPQGLSVGDKVSVGVRFSAPSSSSAVQWLEPEMTADKTHPYMFTQCQAIHARSLVPCQDSPGAKMSYSAAVRVPADLTALMSAVPVEAEQQGVPHLSDTQPEGPTKIFYFKQQVPIPPYLLALAVGRLECRELSPRSRVWSEPSVVDAAAYEFAETAKFLDAGEEIAGEYVWGRYDLLLLPPSFPYGGMENPTLTFVTPTLLAGDRSLTNVVAHEIAHSWTGNLVTNHTWQDFWCNEGFTVFLERKILKKLHGEATFQFHAANGAIYLEEEVKRFGPDHPYTRLVPDLSGGVDPDDVFSKVPYEKGFYFLYYLQTVVGGPDKMDPFLKSYLKQFQSKTVTSQQFKEYFLEYFKDVPEVQQVDWDTWYYAPGMPPVKNSYDTSLAQSAYDLAVKWHTADVMGIGSSGPTGAGAENVAGWSSDQLVAFLDKLGELRAVQPMHASMTSKMGSMYGLYGSKNAEIRAAFYKLAIQAEDPSVLPHVVDLITTQGRMKFLRPLYRALFKSNMGKQLALDTFTAHQNAYHPIAKKMLAADLGLA